MLSFERLDDVALLELVRRTDGLGVLSVYVNADRGGSPHLDGVTIDLKNRFDELRRRMGEDGAHERAREVVAALDRLQPQVEALTSPLDSGRGRVLFAALGSDWTLRLESRMPVANRLVLDAAPFVHPLMEVLDEGTPAGVIVATQEEARLLEWRLGRLRPLGRLDQPEFEASHERAGQIGGGPSGQFHTPVKEQRQARQRDHAERFLDEVVAAAVRVAGERRWGRILVSAGDRWTDTMAGDFPDHLQERLIRDPRVLAGMQGPALEAAVTERLHEEHIAQEHHLAERVRDAAHERRGALGLSEVAAGLNRGRVSHLVYDPEVRYTGSVGVDGVLLAGHESGPDGEPGTPEPRLTERLVERALATGARVTPLEGAAQNTLRESEGIAALLRW